MGQMHAEAGRREASVRSDCYVTIDRRDSGGLAIDIRGKSERFYRSSIVQAVEAMLEQYGIRAAAVRIDDFGALPFTLNARLECAIRRLGKEFDHPPAQFPTSLSNYTVARDRFRRSRLYLPGNEPKFIVNAGLHQPDGIILDLEDSVAPAEKDTARILVRNALQEVDFYGAEKMVRINQLPLGLADLDEIIPCHVHTILIPKCESGQQVAEVADRIRHIRAKTEQPEPVYLMPILESARGILRADEIGAASPLNVALTIGLEDFTADIGAERTQEGRESFQARSMVVLAARAHGLQPIDTVYSDVQNEDGLRQSTLESKQLGFEGRGCIHPRQIRVIHEAFAPSPPEIERAGRIVDALREAEARGSGVVALGSKMIDPPVVKRAQKILKLAKQLGLR
ncbi:MAG: HpcH/HpaI aldolase/citrate lyase family protein [Acidobacteria bacterium]|nr:HpcH/HpaI aldolase/citrate lyase family protein [Acidobacteriota bacterium]